VQRARYARISDGDPAIYRNGHDPQRDITTSAGAHASFVPTRNTARWQLFHLCLRRIRFYTRSRSAT
jgi:hypothetical protein